MQKRKIDELISHFNRKVADMDIDRKYKMELLGMITAIGIAYEKELNVEPEEYYRGKIDGIKECTARLRLLTAEFKNREMNGGDANV